MSNKQIKIFILGMPRSGTKLLRAILNQHSKIFIPDIETEFYPLLSKLTEAESPVMTLGDFTQIFDRLKGLPFFIYLKEAGYQVDMSQWYDACGDYSAAGIFEALISVLASHYDQDAVIMGDKSPSYIDNVPLLLKDFPEAKFIHIVRDARDYSLSINQAWGKNQLRAAYRWSCSIAGLQSQIKSNSSRFIEVRYEDILVDTECELNKLCAFLDIDYESGMLSLKGPSENLGDTRGSSEIVAKNINKYKVKMESRLLEKIEKITCQELRHYGYAVEWTGSSERLNPLHEKLLQIMDGFNLINFEKKQRGVIGAIRFYWSYFRATRAI